MVRRLSRLAAGAASALGVALAAGTAAAYDPAVGTWRTPGGTEVRIERCPAGYCGHIGRIVVPQHIEQRYGAQLAALDVSQYTDEFNKDPALRGRPMLGLQILEFGPTARPGHYEGSIYNPEDGETYAGVMQLLDADTVRVQGCVLYNLICRGEDWVRVGVY